MKLKKAFTLAEAILTMTILGVIAAVMIATIRPASYRQQGFNALKKKVYAEMDGVLQNYIIDCGKNMSALTLYDGCNKTSDSTHTFGAADKGDATTINEKYVRGTLSSTTCATVTGKPHLKLRNGACLYFGSGHIDVDVNGLEGPNEDGSDRMEMEVGADGITTDMDVAMTKGWTVTVNP